MNLAIWIFVESWPKNSKQLITTINLNRPFYWPQMKMNQLIEKIAKTKQGS